jgi:cytochrome P450
LQEEFPYADVISVATSNINAGSDTTAIALRSIIYNLLRTPSAKAKVLSEIDDHRRRGALSLPATYDEAMKLPYLQACMYEGIRVCPSVGINLPRVVPAGGAELGGYYVPEGTVVGANAWVINQDKNIFGADAGVFRPERWLGEKDDMRK